MFYKRQLGVPNQVITMSNLKKIFFPLRHPVWILYTSYMIFSRGQAGAIQTIAAWIICDAYAYWLMSANPRLNKHYAQIYVYSLVCCKLGLHTFKWVHHLFFFLLFSHSLCFCLFVCLFILVNNSKYQLDHTILPIQYQCLHCLFRFIYFCLKRWVIYTYPKY